MEYVEDVCESAGDEAPEGGDALGDLGARLKFALF